jgi:hypothetical protein
LDVHGDATLGFLFLFFGEPRGDPAVKGNVHHGIAPLGKRGDNLPGTRLAGAMFQCAFANQHPHVIHRRRHAAKPEMMGYLPQARGVARSLLMGFDELQNLALALGQFHTVHLNSIQPQGICQQVDGTIHRMPGNETETHRNLKRLALVWARQQGYAIGGVEIRLPHSHFRADVTAYRPETKRLPLPDAGSSSARLVRQPVIGTTAVFECKQARADFLKDSHSATATAQRLKALDARRQTLERLLGMHYPSLRKGETLFSEYDAIDPTNHEHKTYRKVVREIAVLQARLYGKTKFDKMTRYRCANLCYLVVENGVLAGHEAPPGWGLLIRRDDSLFLERLPVWQDVAEPTRLALLQKIALTATRRLNEDPGGPFAPVPS